MSTRRAYAAAPDTRRASGQNVASLKEFATLGNFAARTYRDVAWGGLGGLYDDRVRRIVPYAGITVPEKGQ